jgi:ABC-type glutathione transport system ATPase component
MGRRHGDGAGRQASVTSGEVSGFLGPGGAGKTTTVRMLDTLMAPTSGSATVAGIPLTPENGVEIRRRISIMPESQGLYLRLSVTENLECFAGLYQVPDPGDRIGRALRAVHLAGPTMPAAPCPKACASGSPWPGHCSATRRYCSSTSRPPAWIRSPPATAMS